MCNWICPHCKKSDHSGCDLALVTAMYFEPHWVNGVNTNPDRNWRTSEILCHNCNRIYSHSTNGAESGDKYIGKYKRPKIVKLNLTNGFNMVVSKVVSKGK